MSDEENAALVIKEGLKQLFAPYHDLIDKLLGPAATEVGLSFGDSMKVWRLKRQVRLLQEVKRMTDEAGCDIKPIATRLFFPILEAASIEDDDEMQTRWAALLANEAMSTGSVHPSFIEILKQMAPGDAQLLDRIFDWCEEHPQSAIQWWLISSVTKEQQRESDGEAVANLVRLGLVVTDYDLEEGHTSLKLFGPHPQVFSAPKLREHDTLSDVAVRFVKACPTELEITPKEKGVVTRLISDFAKKECVRCGNVFSPLIVPPTFYKDLNNVCLSAIWNRTDVALQKVKHIIFCGYSFPDADIHIKYLLKRAQTNRNSPMTFTVINQHPGKDPELAKQEKYRYERFLSTGVDFTEGSFEEFTDNPFTVIHRVGGL